MNAATAKTLRKIADTLPTVYINTPEVRTETINGAKHTKRWLQTKKADHYKRLKDVYNRSGEKGVIRYIHITRLTAKQQEPSRQKWEQQLAEFEKQKTTTTLWQKFKTWLKNIIKK